MKKLLLVIPIIFGTLCTTQSFADNIDSVLLGKDSSGDSCTQINDKTNICWHNSGGPIGGSNSCKNIPENNPCTSTGATEAYCQYNGGESLRCTAKQCEKGYFLWVTSKRSKKPITSYDQYQSQGICIPQNWCAIQNCPNCKLHTFKWQGKDATDEICYEEKSNGGDNSPRSYAITYKTNDCGDINTCTDGTAPTAYTTGTGATITCQLNKENSTFNGWCTDEALQNCNITQEIDKKATGNKTFYAKCTKQGGNNGNSNTTVTITCTPGDSSCQTTDIFTQIDSFIGSKFSEKPSVWKNDDGKFNTARLASDSIAGVVLGTVGGVITSNIIKKNQIENGFEDLKCTIGGQTVASYGDEFTVGVK